jgi:hypothetical protein
VVVSSKALLLDATLTPRQLHVLESLEAGYAFILVLVFVFVYLPLPTMRLRREGFLGPRFGLLLLRSTSQGVSGG